MPPDPIINPAEQRDEPSSSDLRMSDDERLRIRRARQAIYLIPALAGLVTVCTVPAAYWIGSFLVTPVGIVGVGAIIVIVNTVLAGIASAVVVSRLHSVERGKWWRAGTSFLFACVMTLAFAIILIVIATFVASFFF